MKIGDPIPCSTCDGDGEVWSHRDYDGSNWRECEACDGTGVVLDTWHRRAYHAISQEAGAVGWPTSYSEDLTVHDRRTCAERDASVPFAWILRECGTHIIAADADGAKLILNCFAPGSWGDKARYYTWDGRRLREVADYKALAKWADGQARINEAHPY